MENACDILARFWSVMGTNDFRAAALLLANDFVLDWPQSGERIRGRDNFARMNEEYPAAGPWRFTVHRIVGGATDAASDVSVTDGALVARALTFASVVDGKISRMVEYWPEEYPAPESRSHLVEKTR